MYISGDYQIQRQVYTVCVYIYIYVIERERCIDRERERDVVGATGVALDPDLAPALILALP